MTKIPNSTMVDKPKDVFDLIANSSMVDKPKSIGYMLDVVNNHFDVLNATGKLSVVKLFRALAAIRGDTVNSYYSLSFNVVKSQYSIKLNNKGVVLYGESISDVLLTCVHYIVSNRSIGLSKTYLNRLKGASTTYKYTL